MPAARPAGRACLGSYLWTPGGDLLLFFAGEIKFHETVGRLLAALIACGQAWTVVCFLQVLPLVQPVGEDGVGAPSL